MTRKPSKKDKKVLQRQKVLQRHVNRSIDTIFHPLFDRSSAFMVVDTVLHGFVEQNPNVTVRKFARYTLPKIIEEILKSR